MAAAIILRIWIASDPMPARRTLPGYRRIVAKVGTNVLTAGSDSLDLPTISALVSQAARLLAEGREVVIVTSGAIAAGRQRLNATEHRRDIPFRQVLAAVGQP